MHPLFHPLFIDYCAYFNGNEDYFECHEVLEEYWKEIAPRDKQHPLVGYIQVATGLYHWRRGNVKGAGKALKNARTLLKHNNLPAFSELIAFPQFIAHIDHSLAKIHAKQPFQPFQITVTNDELNSLVSKHIKSLPAQSKHFLVNKHMLRDRSEILQAREAKKRSRL